MHQNLNIFSDRQVFARCLVLWMLLFLIPSPGIARDAGGGVLPDTSENAGLLQKRYGLAKAYYQNLVEAPGGHESREDWEKGVRAFRQVYLAEPKTELAMDSLFMMGRMYRQMATRFGNPLDLAEAIAYYGDVATLFPGGRLADDALLRQGLILLEEKKDRQRAADVFARLLSLYPNGDMAAEARNRLTSMEDVHGSAAVGTPLPARTETASAAVLPVKFWSTTNYTRVVVKVSSPVRFSERLLEPDGNKPRRLYIDLAASRIAPENLEPLHVGDGLLKQVRVGQYRPDTVRVVLDIESISKYKIFRLYDPFRVVIDVKGVDRHDAPSPPVVINAQGYKKKRTEAGRPAPSNVPSLAQQLGLGVRRIVIDPGHGGKDPGAIAKDGLQEKDVVLKVSILLAEELRKKLGCDVVLTRDRDIFIPLEERTAIANMKKGDLFVSVHVNAAPSAKAKGVETYILNLTTDEDAMRLAAFENATSASRMSDLEDILSDLLNNSKIDESTKLAQHVQKRMVGGMKMKDLGVKQAPFYVLIGAQMPSILSEISFLSNPAEARKLRRESYLSAIASQMAAGVTDYVRNVDLAMAER